MKSKIYLPLLLTLMTSSLTATSSAPNWSPEKMKQKEKYFLRFDANSDQGLSRKEFVEMTRTQFVQKSKTGWEKAGMERFMNNDIDTDGIVYFDEWISNPNHR